MTFAMLGGGLSMRGAFLDCLTVTRTCMSSLGRRGSGSGAVLGGRCRGVRWLLCKPDARYENEKQTRHAALRPRTAVVI